MDFNNFLVSEKDNPIERKKKIEVYFYVLLFILLVSGFWPILIIAIILRSKILYYMDQSIKTSFNSASNSSKKSYIEHIHYPEKNIIKTDQTRNILAIFGFIIIILLSLAYYIFKNYNLIN